MVFDSAGTEVRSEGHRLHKATLMLFTINKNMATPCMYDRCVYYLYFYRSTEYTHDILCNVILYAHQYRDKVLHSTRYYCTSVCIQYVVKVLAC